MSTSEERPSHPLHDNAPAQGGHPLTDQPPEKAKNEAPGIPIPLAAETPYLTYALVVINVGIFALRFILPELAETWFNAGFANSSLILQDGQYYRLFTTMFLHWSAPHILFNGLALYYIGSNLERLFGHLRFGIIYFLGGLLGSIAILFIPNAAGAGASGAVFAIWGAEVVFLYRHRKILAGAAQQRLQSSLVLMVMNFVAGFTGNAVADIVGSDQARIGNLAHLGGLVGGALLAWIIAPIFTAQRTLDAATQKATVKITDSNPLDGHLREVLFFSCGLLALIIIAGFLMA